MLSLFGKVHFVQALRLCTGRTAHRGSRGIALPFLDYGTRRGWGVSFTPRPLFTPGKVHSSVVFKKNLLDCWNCVRFCPKRNVLFNDWFIQSRGLHCCKFPVVVTTTTEMVTAGPRNEWFDTSYKNYGPNPSRGVNSFEWSVNLAETLLLPFTSTTFRNLNVDSKKGCT